MPRLRLFLAGLLMAALPLQGWAAATMLFCGPARPAVHAHVEGSPAHAHHRGDPAAHANTHVHGQTQQPADAAAGHAHAAGDAQAAGTDAHGCSACAACSHSVALAQTQWPAAVPALPRADLAEPLVCVLAFASPVPDKPPRA